MSANNGALCYAVCSDNESEHPFFLPSISFLRPPFPSLSFPILPFPSLSIPSLSFPSLSFLSPPFPILPFPSSPFLFVVHTRTTLTSSCTYLRSLSEEESTDSNHFGQAFVSSTRSQLVSHISTLHGTSLIFSALSARKKSSFLLHREGTKWTNVREARDEHEDALETLDDFSYEAKVLIGVLKVILTTLDSNVKLSSFMNHPQQEFSFSGLRRTRLDSSEEMLPAVLCSDNLLLDVLNDRLHSKVTFRFPIIMIISFITAVSSAVCPSSQSVLLRNVHSILTLFYF